MMFTTNSIAVLIALIMAFADVSAQKVKFQNTGPKENQTTILSSEFIDSIKKAAQEKMITLKKDRRISEEEESIYKMLLDDKSDPEKCEETVVRYMRKRYVNSDIIPPNTTIRINSEHGLGIRGLSTALFWLKGKASGLYEYFKLTGGVYPLSDNVICEEPEQHAILMRFALYDLITDLPRRNINLFVLDKPALYSSRLEEIKRILHTFGPDNKVLNDFVVSYPFMDGSYIKIRELDFTDPRYRYPMPETEQLLAEYYDQLLISEGQKIDFLSKIKDIYGREKLAYLLNHISKNDKMVDEKPFYCRKIVELAIENKMWESITEFLSKPAEQPINGEIIEMLEKAEREIEVERQTIGIIKKVLKNDPNQPRSGSND